MSGRQSVSSLAASDVAAMSARDSVHEKHVYHEKHSGYDDHKHSGYDDHCDTKRSSNSNSNSGAGYGVGWFLLVWIVLTVVIWLILVAINPPFLRGAKCKGGSKFDSSNSSGKGKCGQCDYGRAFLAALVIAFILIIILWAVYAATRGTGYSKM
jgi:hypothetical protein